jgi:hypothetical protein
MMPEEPVGLRMAILFNTNETTTRGEQSGQDQAPSAPTLDPHSERLLRDHADWHARLAMLAELRDGRGER